MQPKKTVSVAVELKSELNRISSSLDERALIEELKSCISVTAEQVVKMASIVKRLEDLGVTSALARLHNILRN